MLVGFIQQRHPGDLAPIWAPMIRKLTPHQRDFPGKALRNNVVIPEEISDPPCGCFI